jgi:hypothetical protein
MKTTFTILMGCACFFLCGSTVLQTSGELLTGLRKGDASLMARHFDQTIEVVLPESRSSYNRNQAEVLIRDFFNIHTVIQFEVLHKGTQSNAQFCIGILQTRKGKFRTTVYQRQKDDRQLVQELRFERE